MFSRVIHVVALSVFHFLQLENDIQVCAAAAAAKSLQSCLTLCNPIDGSPLGSTVPGILQARTLEWVAIAFFAVFLPSTCVFEMEQTALYHICTRFPDLFFVHVCSFHLTA